MENIFDRLNELLENAEKAATLENACFGFPNDRIEVKSVHFGDDRTGRVGDVLHPTDYVRNITSLHHSSWIISPIRQARELLQLHADTLRDAEKLRGIFLGLNRSALMNDIEIISQRAKVSLNT